MRKLVIDNPRYPHHIRITRLVLKDWLDGAESSGSSSSSSSEGQEDREVIVYDGPGRSYTDTTTTGDAKVDTNKRKCSIPVRFDKWRFQDDGRQLVPMSGDMVYVTKGCIHEEWEVKDFEPDNDRSVVYGEHNRNFNEQ